MLIGILFARGVGNLLIPSLYNFALKLKHVPMLSHRISRRAKAFTADVVMDGPVVSFQVVESLQDVYTKLCNCKHNGFPVVNHKNEVVGLISRNFLCIIIKQKFFEEEGIRKSRIEDLT